VEEQMKLTIPAALARFSLTRNPSPDKTKEES
jgi:hypothetical protein